MAKNKKRSLRKKTTHKFNNNNDVSRASQVAEKLLWVSGVKKTFLTAEAAYKMIKDRLIKNRTKRHIPKLKNELFKNDDYIEEYYIFGKLSSNDLVIIYLHGGSYVFQPARFHWKFLDRLYSNLNIPIIVPLYPKAPEYNYLDCYKYLDKIYKDISKTTNNIILMGDSAGGGLALAFSQYLINKNSNIPKKLILLSPWLDLSLSNPKIERLEKVDPMLSKLGLLETAKAWSNNSDLTNYMLSPINGSLDKLPPITLFVGTHELFLYDCRLFHQKLNHHHIHNKYYEYKNMNHVFPLYPIPEAKKAFNQIVHAIKNI